MPNSKEVIIWTIYDHPTDYLMCYVARKYFLDTPTDEIVADESLDAVRRKIQKKSAIRLFCLGRQPEDAPVIVESWI